MTLRMRGSLVAAALLATACTNDSSPSDVLTGFWSTDGVQFSATSRGATFDEECLHAAFAPLRLDGAGALAAHSDTLIETGNVFHLDTDTLSIAGRMVGNQVILTVYVIRTEPPESDPVVITLTAGGSRSALVCTA